MMWDLRSLFLKHARDIDRFLRRRGHNAETAADIAQDTFVRLLAAGPKIASAHDNPKAYLYQISRNLSIDYQRRERLMPRVTLSDEDLARVADPSPSPEILVYNKQRLAITLTAINELPDRTRRAFELHRLDNLTINEVAREVGLSTTRTWALIRDAYRSIRSRLHGL
ncbi:MAG: sigma-70 family RNA polymerase sigma factor [Rhizobiales bacterium]|nr:sigma-70 family RNA polymerase sigma factor [Hyphomicrobiales bacterium]